MKSLTSILIVLIIGLNVPLFGGAPADALLFRMGDAMEGEWWRLLTFPFVHVSFYHLVLDAGAFLLLWWSRPGTRSPRSDIMLFSFCYVGSLVAALTSESLWAQNGFCGLSGIGHGLMAYHGAVWMLETGGDRMNRSAGVIMVVMVVAKCLFEVITNGVVFSFMHAGDVGTPITACHAGGVAGGLLCGLVASFRQDQDLPQTTGRDTNPVLS